MWCRQTVLRVGQQKTVREACVRGAVTAPNVVFLSDQISGRRTSTLRSLSGFPFQLMSALRPSGSWDEQLQPRWQCIPKDFLFKDLGVGGSGGEHQQGVHLWDRNILGTLNPMRDPTRPHPHLPRGGGLGPIQHHSGEKTHYTVTSDDTSRLGRTSSVQWAKGLAGSLRCNVVRVGVRAKRASALRRGRGRCCTGASLASRLCHPSATYTNALGSTCGHWCKLQPSVCIHTAYMCGWVGREGAGCMRACAIQGILKTPRGRGPECRPEKKR